MKRKLMSGCLALLFLTSVVATGCSSKSSGNESASPITPAEPIGAKTDMTAESPVKSKPELKGKVRIGFVGLQEKSAPDAVTGIMIWGADELKKRLKADYPNVDFEIITYPGADHQAKAKALVESDQIDVSIESDSKFMWNQGLSVDLTPYEQKDKEWNIDLYLSPTLYTGGLEVGADGNKVNNALHLNVSGSGNYYDKKLFADYGVEPLSPNASWEEILDKAKKLTGKDPKTGEQTYGVNFDAEYSGTVFLQTLIANTYGGDLGKMGSKEYLNQVKLNSPEMIKAAEYMKELLKYTPPGIMQGQGSEKWATDDNDVGMYLNQTAMVIQTLKAVKKTDRFDVALLPKGPNGTAGFQGGLYAQVVKSAQDKDLAWEITKWFSVGNGQKFFWDSRNRLPVSIKSFEKEINKDDAIDKKTFDMAAAAMDMSPIWFTAAKFDATTALEEIFLKNVPAKDALDKYQAKLLDEFAKMKAADAK